MRTAGNHRKWLIAREASSLSEKADVGTQEAQSKAFEQK